MNQRSTPDSRKANPKLVLALLIIVFLGPFLFALGMYKRSDNLSFSYINQGELILPPVPIDTLDLQDSKTMHPLPIAEITGKWTVAYLLPELCSEYCHQNLYNIRQLHVALGKEADRVQRNVWFLPHQDKSLNGFIDETYPDVAQSIVKQEGFIQYLNPWVDETERAEMGAFYVVDPLGNVMMAYAGDMPPKSIMKDLKRLLKVSKIG